MESSNSPPARICIKDMERLFRMGFDWQHVLNVTYLKNIKLSEILCVWGSPKMNLKLGTLAKNALKHLSNEQFLDIAF